jgi:hypothetical protein
MRTLLILNNQSPRRPRWLKTMSDCLTDLI